MELVELASPSIGPVIVITISEIGFEFVSPMMYVFPL